MTHRRRRPLRPRPTRSQIHQQIRQIGRTLQLVQLEALVEVQKSAPRLDRLRYLDDAAAVLRDEAAAVEKL